MNDGIRTKLEALISDSGMFNAGQQEERCRIQKLIDIRIYQLQSSTKQTPHITSVCAELLRLRNSLNNDSV
jgi:hypothetical protein